MYVLTNLAGEPQSSADACLDADASTKPCWVRCAQVDAADGPRRYLRANAAWPDLAEVGFSAYADLPPVHEGGPIVAPDARFPSLRFIKDAGGALKPYCVRFAALLFGAPVNRPGVQFPLDEFDVRCINYRRAAQDPTWYDLQFTEKRRAPGYAERQKAFAPFLKQQSERRMERRAEFICKKRHILANSGEMLAAARARTLEAYPKREPYVAEDVDAWRARHDFTRVAQKHLENLRAVTESAQADASAEPREAKAARKRARGTKRR